MDSVVIAYTGQGTYDWQNVQANGALTVSFASSVSYTNVVNGLVARWELNERTGGIAYDSSGHGNYAILDSNGNPFNSWGTTWYNFYNVEFMSLNSINLGVFSPNLTFTAWVNPNYSGNGMAIVGGSGAGSPEMFLTSDTPPRIGFYSTGYGVQVLSTGTVATNTWTHVAVTYSAGVYNFYTNGILSSGGSGFSPPFYNNNYTELGGSFDGYFLYGSVSNINIFNRALSANEILNVFEKAQ